jgi:hypothetical protein
VTEVKVEKVPEIFAGKVVIPSTVDKITGVPAGNITVKAAGGVDITVAIQIAQDGTISLNKDATVTATIGGKEESIKVEPQLVATDATGAAVEPFELPTGENAAVAEANVATIPGLKYSLVWDSDLSFTSKDAGNSAPVQATGYRLKLQDTSSNKPNVRFYKVKVTK